MKFKKCASSLLTACVISSMFSVVAMAASESLNNGGATWYGGEADNEIYSRLEDNANDGMRYKVTVWVQNDKGDKSDKSGTTSGVGTSGSVEITKAATHSNPFVPEKSGYKNFSVVR